MPRYTPEKIQELKKEFKTIIEDPVLTKICHWGHNERNYKDPEGEFDEERFIRNGKEFSKGFGRLIEQDLEHL